MLDALEYSGQTYMAFCPAVEEGTDEDSEDYGLVILKTIEENGEELLSTLDRDEELNTVYDLFMERLCDAEANESPLSTLIGRILGENVPIGNLITLRTLRGA